MIADRQPRIFLVDDEPVVCKAISQTLEELNAVVTCFTRPGDCLAAVTSEECDLVISDLNMPEMDGITLLKAIKQVCPLLPVLMVTGYGDVPMAVKAVKAGALDFIEKPLDETTFLPLVQNTLSTYASSDHVSIRPLTSTERKILEMIVDGKGNKEIAYQLTCSVRTVENHRYRLMHKLKVDSTAALVRTALLTKLVAC